MALTVVLPSLGVTKRCRLSWLTNSAQMQVGGIAVSQLYTGAQINFGVLTPYLTSARTDLYKKSKSVSLPCPINLFDSNANIFYIL
jgi:hypothetical protein